MPKKIWKKKFKKRKLLFCTLPFILLAIIYKYIFKKNLKSIYIYERDERNNLSTIDIKPYNLEYEKSSKDYWEKRYKNGGNSGAGSYNNLAKFKASILNDFVNRNNINTIIEWGSGDCNQLLLSNYKRYIGYDVSKTAIDICRKKFFHDKTKTFFHLDDNFINDKKADLSISLDVIFHLIEDEVFDLYMKNLFNSSKKYVCIYSTNINKGWASHVKHRKFTDWIDKHISNEWKLKEFIPNKYPFDPRYSSKTSFSNFYFFEKLECKLRFFNKCIIK